MALVELSGHTNPTQLPDVAKPLPATVKASRQEVEHSTFENEWSIIYKGYDSKEEQAWRRRFTLGNGIITVVPRVIDYGSTPITKIRGLFEQKPPSQDDLQSPVPGGLNIPDFCHFEISIGETELQIDTSTLVRKFDIKYQKLTTEFDAADGQGRRVAVAVDEFASLSKPHKYVRRITIVPQYSGEISLSMGVNGDVPNNGHGYYKSHEAKALEDCFGVAYDAKTKYRNHEIAIAQRADVYSDDQETVSDTTIKAGDKSIYHKITLPVKAGKTCTIINVTSVHSTADSEKWEGIDLNLAAESRRETAVAEDYSVLLSEHIAVCEKRWNAIKIQIDGDEDVMRALRFNLGHSMAEAPEGYAYAGVGAKIGNNPFEAYGDRHFWDADIYLRHGLTPEQVKTLVIDYRHNLLPAAQKKAEKYFAKASQTQKLNWPFKRKGAFWPWESTVPTNNGEDGEGCPEWIINSLGIKAPIESLEEEIHISADIALAVTEYYWMTGNEELMRTKGAEMILEAARFYASRAVYNQKQDRYEYHHVTGPDEYHPGVDNNAYTNYLAKWTINEAIKLIREKMVDDTVLIKTGLTAEEVWEWEKRAEKIYIPFDIKTGVVSQFDGFDSLKHIDLKEYKGIRTMDVELQKERTPRNKKEDELTPDERNPVRGTDVIKQHDVLLLLDLLGKEILDLLPKDAQLHLRSTGKTDDEIMRKINRANYDRYYLQVCDGSSLSPLEGVRASLNASAPSDEVYEKYIDALSMDLGNNTYDTGQGLHTANMGGSLWATRGFPGLRLSRDGLTVDPALPSKWQRYRDGLLYRGQQVAINIDIAKNTIHAAVLNPTKGVPMKIKGQSFVLTAENPHISVPYQ